MARTATASTPEVTTSEASARPRRAPLGKRNRLNVQNKEPGYQYRIVNDIDDRVDQLTAEDWEIVPNARVGAIGNRQVDGATSLGSQPYISVGKGVKATVMRKRDEWKKEDDAIKQREIDELEETTRQDAKKRSDYGDLRIPS